MGSETHYTYTTNAPEFLSGVTLKSYHSDAANIGYTIGRSMVVERGGHLFWWRHFYTLALAGLGRCRRVLSRDIHYLAPGALGGGRTHRRSAV